MYKSNKSKNHQSIKIEKDSENISLRKKVKKLTADKQFSSKKETVWERLSKLKRVSSANNLLGATTPPKTSKRLQYIKSSIQSNDQRKPLTSADSLNKPSQQQQNVVPELTSLFSEVVSTTSLNKIRKTLSPSSLVLADVAYECYSEDSTEEYISAPLLTSYSSNSEHNERKTIVNNSVEIFQCTNEPMIYEGVERINKYFMQPDKLEKKYFPKNQLENFYVQEFISNQVPEKLTQSLKLESALPVSKPLNYSDYQKDMQKLQVDVVFKNIPSLHKEIEILKALGEKLEATLKSTTSHIMRHDTLTTNVLHKVKYTIYDLPLECHAQVIFQAIGFRYCVGIANEFRIAQKSLVELKRDSSSVFYMPSNSENVHMIRTSFKNLQKTPNKFLQHVKPRDGQATFNLLEQDPIFFHHAFNKLTNISNILSTNSDPLPHRETYPECTDVMTCETDSKTVILKSVNREKPRRRIRRCMTPLPLNNYCSPKNSLIKTILIGLTQMSVFIVFIMALTYPDATC